jgi:hypothetical protein
VKKNAKVLNVARKLGNVAQVFTMARADLDVGDWDRCLSGAVGKIHRESP